MSYLTTVLGWLKVAWPVISLIVGGLSGAHANASRVEAKSGAVSMESQAVNVAGAGLLGSALIVAGAAGVASNHKAASSAPSKAPEGVDPVLHQESVLHAAMIADPAATPEEFNKLNELVLIRKKPR